MRKFLIFCIAMMLSISPLITQAASKKAHKQMVATSKHKYVHNKSGKMRVNYRLRNSKNTKIYADTYNGSSPLKLASAKALVINQATGETVFGKNTSQLTPIASVTKLMTAMVMLDAHLPMDEVIIISNEDVDYLKGTTSRLSIGTALSRGELLQLALIASENRAASALGRNYPGGIIAFVRAMNRKAESLAMKSTHFVDSSGLDSNNVSTAEDLAKMVNAAYHYPQIREISTTATQAITPFNRARPINVVNTNSLVRGSNWMIGLSKTGFINEAGRCLVMQAEISGQPMIIVLLDSVGKQSRIGDANRIRKWVEYNDANSLGEKVSG